MTFEQVVLLLLLLGGAIYITFQISWTIFIAIFKNSAYQNSIFAICSLRMLLVH